MNFENKFIAFIDILGFKNLVLKAENGQELTLVDIIEITDLLQNKNDYENILENGPIICPESEKLQNDLRFEVTQISDCLISSSEVSPAGLINLISHSWGSTFKLMKQGIMCRGYITMGSIFHSGNYIIGSGYQNAFENEKSKIKVFRKDADETGTPFVEIDPFIKKYVEKRNDECLKKTFARYTKTKDGFTALFPFKQFSFISEAFVSSAGFERKKSKVALNMVRNVVIDFKKKVLVYIKNSNKKAEQKAEYYLEFLNQELKYLDHLENDIDMLNMPFQ